MKTLKTTVVIAALLVLTALAACAQGSSASCAQACPAGKEVKVWGSLDSKPKTNEAYQPEKVVIGIGAYEMFEIRNGAAGYSLAEREIAVYNRLTEILSKVSGAPGTICVGQVRSAPTLFIGPYRFISVYAQDAAAFKMTQSALAAKWAAQIGAVLPRVVTENAALKPKQPPYEVAVGGLSILRLRDKDGYATVKARGRAIEDQLVLVLSDGRKAKLHPTAVPVGVNWAVKYGDLTVVEATPTDAVLNHSTPQLLATAWAADLDAALAKLKAPTGAAAPLE